MRHQGVAMLFVLSWMGSELAAAPVRPRFAAVQDANGVILGPVVDSSVFTVEVGGKIALPRADRTTLSGVAGASVWFATADCSGQAYVEWDPSFLSPPSTIGGPANTV